MSKINCPKCGTDIEITPEDAASILGKKGGSSKSKSKIEAIKENGKKGGRPRVDNPVRRRPYHDKPEEL
jgi:hypothetical protein